MTTFFCVEASRKLLSHFDLLRAGGAVFVPHWPVFGFHLGLRGDTAELGLPNVGLSIVSFARPPLGFFGHPGHACAMHLRKHHRDPLADGDRQLPLQGFLSGVLHAVGDIAPMLSVVRSIAFVVTSRPANSFTCSWPRSKEEHSLPTSVNLRRTPGTPGESSVFSTSSAASVENCPSNKRAAFPHGRAGCSIRHGFRAAWLR